MSSIDATSALLMLLFVKTLSVFGKSFKPSASITFATSSTVFKSSLFFINSMRMMMVVYSLGLVHAALVKLSYSFKKTAIVYVES
mgnify:CR=1 FL=1